MSWNVCLYESTSLDLEADLKCAQVATYGVFVWLPSMDLVVSLLALNSADVNNYLLCHCSGGQ